MYNSQQSKAVTSSSIRNTLCLLNFQTMASTIIPSEEQAAIVEFMKSGANVVGDCVAGSGKTTSILLVAASLPTKRILKVTYNKALKFEVRQKALAKGLTNIEIHTYNSLCVKYYDREGYNNEALRRAVERNAVPLTEIPEFDMIVLDETQDMNILFYGLVRKFLKDSRRPIEQMLVLGDKFQSIYGFIGADNRFLTFCHELWNRKFIPLTLTTSYRVTHSIATFVNRLMLGYDRIKAVRSGPPVELIYCNPYKSARLLCEKILGLISAGVCNAGDIFILAPSIKGAKSPVRLLENRLVTEGISCYLPVSDEAQLDEEIIEGKVVFSTYHQAKGRERRVVIVYNFDKNYFTLYNQSANPFICAEPLYVATTRPLDRLILLHDNKSTPLPFLQCDVRDLPADVVTITEYHPVSVTDDRDKAPRRREEKHRSSPTELTAYLKESNITLLAAIVDQVFTVEHPPSYKVEIPSKITFEGGNTEDVSDVNGIVIPAIYEARLHGCSTIETIVRNKCEQIKDIPFLYSAYMHIGTTVRTATEFLRLTIFYISFMEKIYNKIGQIKHHNWLTAKMVAQCFSILVKYITAEATFEEAIDFEICELPEFGKIVLDGRIDAFDKETIFEIKCVDALILEHKLQLLIYAWMWNKKYEATYGPRNFKLLNTRSGEVLVLDSKSPLLNEAVYIMLHNKYGKSSPLEDAAFVKRCLELDFNKMPVATNAKAMPLFVDED